MKEGRGRILVVRGGAIGDFILTLPVLAALRRQFPESRLEVLGYTHIVQLAVAGGLTDAVRSIEARALAGFFARNGRLDPELADCFARFAIILSFLYDPDGVFQENVGRCSRAQFVAGPHRPEEKANQHATGAFLKPLERLAIFDADPVPRLNVSPSPDVCLPAGEWLALHPGSGSEQKNWPEDNWRKLMTTLLRTTELNLLLVGGEAEGERLQQLAAAVAPKRIQLARSLPLSRLAGYLQRCGGFVGHDSGISHLAAALGLPCRILWGPSVAAVWRPLGDNVRIVQSDQGLAGIRVEEVLDQVRESIRAPGSPVPRSSPD